MLKNKISKKNAAMILTGILTIAVSATVMAAPGGPGGPGGSEGFKGAGGQRPSFEEGERPELPSSEEGERPELPSFEEGERPELPEGEMPEEDGKNGPGMRGMKMKDIDTSSIQTAIEALEDEDVKAKLEILLGEYTDAKASLDTAFEEESDDIDTYRKAEMEAMKALREALDEAGIDTRPELPEGVEAKDAEKPELSEDEDAPQPKLNEAGKVIKKGNTEGSLQTGNRADRQNSTSTEKTEQNKALDKLVNWLRSLLS